MATKFDEFSDNIKDYQRILLSCLISSEAIYGDDPIKKLNEFDHDLLEKNQFKHLIKESLFSQTVSTKTHSIKCKSRGEFDSRYMVSNNEDKELMIITFRGSKEIKDWITDAKFGLSENVDAAGKVHQGFYDRCHQIPIDFFKDKALCGYRLIFTGHSLGAAVASLVSLCVLRALPSKYHKKIMCIGFGSPAIGCSAFAKDANENFMKNFHFYINENDPVVDLLIKPRIILPIINKVLKDKLKGMSKEMLLSYHGFTNEVDNKLDRDILMTKIIESKIETVVTSARGYEHFGTFIQVFGQGKIEIYDEYPCLKDHNLSDHKMKNYLSNLILVLKNSKSWEKLNTRSSFTVRKFNELFVPSTIEKVSAESLAFNTFSVSIEEPLQMLAQLAQICSVTSWISNANSESFSYCQKQYFLSV